MATCPLMSLVAAEFGFFFQVIIAAVAAAKTPYTIDWLVAIPATALGLQCEQHAGVACRALPWGRNGRLLVETRFDHDVLLNFAVRPDGM